MWERLQGLKSPVPKNVFKSFGYSLEEKWREDGFVVLFAPGEADDARAAIIEVAKEFKQGAIFEYHRSELGDRFLMRTTVPALVDEGAETVTMVRIAAAEKGNLMLDRAWAGPAEAGW